jgi:hypothetical protein
MSPSEQSGSTGPGGDDTIAHDPSVAQSFALKSAAESLTRIQRNFEDGVRAAGNPVPEVRGELDEQVKNSVGPITEETKTILTALTQLVQGKVVDQATMDKLFRQLEESTAGSTDANTDAHGAPRH